MKLVDKPLAWQSLLQLWEANGEKPFEAENEHGVRFRVIGVDRKPGLALGWSGDLLDTASLQPPMWRIYQKPERIKLYAFIAPRQDGELSLRFVLQEHEVVPGNYRRASQLDLEL